jgi:signal transduction histidine kinase
MNLREGAVAVRLSRSIDYGGFCQIRHGHSFGGISVGPPSRYYAAQDELLKELSRAIADGSESNDLLGELAASIAYQMNEPLTAIVVAGETALHWLDQEPADLDSARRLVSGMAADARRAAVIVEKAYLAMSYRAKDFAPTQLNDLVREAISSLEIEIDRHRIEIATDLAPSLPLTVVDRARLLELLRELTLSAILSLAQGGLSQRLVIRTRLADPQSLRVEIEHSGPTRDLNATQHLRTSFPARMENPTTGPASSREFLEMCGVKTGANNEAGGIGAQRWLTLSLTGVTDGFLNHKISSPVSIP